MIIEPTVGRVVWYCPPKVKPSQLYAAFICFVQDDGTINLMVIQRNGSTYGLERVRLIQEGEEKPESGNYAQWMPYQVGQAKRNA